MTGLFVMLAEVLIFAPSVARYRLMYLQQRLAEAHLAAHAVEAAPGAMVTQPLEGKLLDAVGAHAIDVVLPDKRVYMLAKPVPPGVAEIFDLRVTGPTQLIVDAFTTLLRTDARVIQAIGHSPKDATVTVTVMLDEAPLRAEMRNFGWRILALSIVISLITAGLVFLSLNWLLVRPMQRITRSMMAFHDDPEDPSAIMVPGRRTDEVGIAERELARMQAAVRSALRQKQRLAALGTAVTKINHDLRGILSNATLISERLSGVDDPEVQRVTPRLMKSLDRAVDLCQQVVSYSRDGVMPLKRSSFSLHGLIAEVAAEVGTNDRRSGNGTGERANPAVAGEGTDVALLADREQLFRALVNLVRNALEAGADRVAVVGSCPPGRCVLRVGDNGPGLPPRAREHLFHPFVGSARVGGTGLGLAIAREIVRAHGGDLRLESSTAEGTSFVLELPGGGVSG